MYGVPVLEIRRSRDRLIFNIGIPILVRRYLHTETAPVVSMFNLWIITGAELLPIQHNKQHSIVDDALARYVARPSAATILITWSRC